MDTNVLLRSIDVGHAAQPVAQEAMIRLRQSGESLSVFPQNLIEFWAVATRPVANNGLGLSIAQAEVELINLKISLRCFLTSLRSFPSGKESSFNTRCPVSKLMTPASSQPCSRTSSRTFSVSTMATSNDLVRSPSSIHAMCLKAPKPDGIWYCLQPWSLTELTASEPRLTQNHDR